MEEEIACSGFFRAATEETISCLDSFQASGWWQFVLGNLLEAFYNIFYALLNPQLWLAWLPFINAPMDDLEVKQSLMR
ncbi:MAG: C4-dicarboxylate ABC transporter permease, partial [Pseudomonadota bacterium]